MYNPIARQLAMADRIDAGMNTMQPSCRDVAVDRALRKAQRKELPPCADAMLPSGQVRQHVRPRFPSVRGGDLGHVLMVARIVWREKAPVCRFGA
jgi:hypothetical protein